ncbi:PREDICTED: ancient ubiquitous protein 1 [Elephantulus edwardii]|uniref:ancient ubiquitous protein 1 n=1 Tax=Elephantulus edwardii TaxID=28737 RepID=UPI0003F063CD|nr:PREDICTED: ancient ubiquitous protein 1 [Elephantulus edwardii]
MSSAGAAPSPASSQAAPQPEHDRARGTPGPEVLGRGTPGPGLHAGSCSPRGPAARHAGAARPSGALPGRDLPPPRTATSASRQTPRRGRWRRRWLGFPEVARWSLRRLVVRTVCAVLGLVAGMGGWGTRGSGGRTGTDPSVRRLVVRTVCAVRSWPGMGGSGAGSDPSVCRLVVRTMCAVLGLVARQEDEGLRDDRVRVLVANHVTPFDHNMVSLLTSCSTPLLDGPPSFLCWSRGFLEVDGRGQLVESLKRFCASTRLPPTPLLLFPEEEATNGREGLLRFSSWPFSIQDVVQPLTLRVQRPLVSVTVSDASWVSELLWALFVPFTVYQVRWLRPVHRQLGEGNEEFALRVQQLVAKELGQTGTRLTPADKAEHMKRQRHPRTSRPPSAHAPFSPSSGLAPGSQLLTLAQRVKEVLPHVPLSVIQRDLARTGCVDLTITNLLEGAVAFMPEDITEGTQSHSSTSTPKFPSSGPATPAPTTLTFAKSSWARQESLQERKQALYEYARRRFTERQARQAD